MTDFDPYDRNYKEVVNRSVAFTGLDVDFFARVKADYLLDLLRQHVGDPARASVLDLGCGIGTYAGLVGPQVARYHGVDVSAKCIATATARHPSHAFAAYDGVVLPHAAASFDAVFAVCVFHHIAPQARASVVAEARRVLRPGGVFAIFEHNPRNPLTRRAVDRCELDDDAILLPEPEARSLIGAAGFEAVRSAFILSIPARGGLLRTIDGWFSPLRLGAQYYSVGLA
jgi:SAM-dependent methyltransferase